MTKLYEKQLHETYLYAMNEKTWAEEAMEKVVKLGDYGGCF